ncbi:GNAT family N-acetyltransferase [Streptomyces buecherae]|uniref:GNAT family N-acetyltransferase n=1 Tax=Streptomyces buecherae TaxID=2763006 RepID=A0A7H8NE15_9ACTN|nr:GNAT family N-acetyltransferase [Streptomyces buecherae]QKW51988.1 GNAT family N-acetyltransferase [Streptomyces buecherae]
MFHIEDEVNHDRRNVIEERLEDTNSARSPVMRALRGTPADDERPLQLYARDADGELAGGLVGYAWGHWLHVDLLWVDERWRGAGLGSRLMAEAERKARDELDCVHARVETWGFQAPRFYEKLGYKIVGVVEDYPPGETDHLLVKRIADA